MLSLQLYHNKQALDALARRRLRAALRLALAQWCVDHPSDVVNCHHPCGTWTPCNVRACVRGRNLVTLLYRMLQL
jgi:hypothetical protein